MSVIVAGTLDFDPKVVPDILLSATGHIQAALAEEGCIHYSWTVDPITPGRINVFEEWTDEGSLQAHFEGAPYRDMLAHLPMSEIRGFDVSKYRFDAKMPVYDDSGTPVAKFS